MLVEGKVQEITRERLRQEVSSGFKPLALDVGLSELPYDDLGDREFENLVYCLIESEIKAGEYGGFDRVVLMQGVGERGRDCVLYKSQKVSGVVQCKKLKRRLTRPALIKELVKFVLFAKLDESLLPSDGAIEYHCYASGGFTETSLSLVSSIADEISIEKASGRLFGYVTQVLEEFESFSELRESPPLDWVFRVLSEINIKSFDSFSINARLSQKNSVLSSFFKVQLVVEHEAVREYFKQELESAGLNFLTDESLRSLHARLMSTAKDLRVGLGSVDLYGFSMGFMKFLEGEGFSDLLKKSTDLRKFLDESLVGYISEKLGKVIFKELSEPFVGGGLIIPFTVNVIHQYLLRLLLPKLSEGSMPEKIFIMMYPLANKSNEEVLALVLSDAILSQKKVSQGDYSSFPNPDPDRAKRLWLFEALRAGCQVENLEERFWQDMKKVQRIVHSIFEEISREVVGVRTVVVKDSAFLSDAVEMKRVAESLRGMK